MRSIRKEELKLDDCLARVAQGEESAAAEFRRDYEPLLAVIARRAARRNGAPVAACGRPIAARRSRERVDGFVRRVIQRLLHRGIRDTLGPGERLTWL